MDDIDHEKINIIDKNTTWKEKKKKLKKNQ